VSATRPYPRDFMARARAIHERVITLDTHNDMEIQVGRR
jgi:hypothetical protein